MDLLVANVSKCVSRFAKTLVISGCGAVSGPQIRKHTPSYDRISCLQSRTSLLMDRPVTSSLKARAKHDRSLRQIIFNLFYVSCVGKISPPSLAVSTHWTGSSKTCTSRGLCIHSLDFNGENGDALRNVRGDPPDP